MKRYYTRAKFNLLLGQLRQGMNLTATTSAGRVLDAAAVLLGFCRQRTYEGEPALELEANSRPAPKSLAPVIVPAPYGDNRQYLLATTPLFRYLVANLAKNRHVLATVVQTYLAEGFWRLARKLDPRLPVVFGGGVAYNRIITTYLTRQGVLINQKIPPGDGGISFGQLQY